MKKKKFILLILLVFLFTSIMSPVEKAEANAVSKVISLAAVKAVKEVATKEAVSTLGSLALKEISTDVAKNYTKKNGFKLVVIEGTKRNPKKVAQVIDYNSLSSSQKSRLGDKIGEILEQKIYGAKMTTWQNFIDAIIPLWSVVGAVSFINLAINGEMKEFLEEVVWEALKELGWLIGVTPVSDGIKNPIGFDSPSTDSPPVFDGEIVADGFQPALPPEVAFQETFNLTSYDIRYSLSNTGLISKDSVIILDFQVKHENETFTWATDDKWLSTSFSYIGSVDFVSGGAYFSSLGLNEKNVSFQIRKNGSLLWSANKDTLGSSSGSGWGSLIELNRAKRIIIEPIKIIGSQFVSIVTVITFRGDVFELKKIATPGDKNIIQDLRSLTVYLPGLQFDYASNEAKVRITGASNIDLITVLPYEPISSDFSFINISDFVVPPITNVPLTNPNGEPLTVTQNDKGELVVLNPQGQPVPETDIVVNDFPVTTPNSEPNTDVPTGGGGFETGDPTKVNWPKLKMIGTAFTTAFPFSLPWDVKNALDSAFGSVDQLDKVQFDWKIGGTTIPISIPEYFMNWFKYIRGFVLLGFDVALIYAIRKWFGGAT